MFTREPAAGVPDSRVQISRGTRRRDIQGLRAVAVVVVVAYHAGLPIPGGFVGVDVFFVISGFVITSMLQREWAATGRIRFGSFYFKRFKRLTPALAVMVTVTMLASALVLSPVGAQQTAAKTAVGAALLSANYVIATTTGGYFDAPAETNPLLHTWSLSVEEQFYLAFPAILALGWTLTTHRRLRATAVVLVAVVLSLSFAAAILGSSGNPIQRETWWLGFYSPLSRAWEFAVGALLALVGSRLKGISARTARLSAASGAMFLAASFWLIDSNTPFPGTLTLLPVLATALLILAGTHGNLATRLLSSRPLVRVGDLSYSIYLWHWPFIVMAGLIWPSDRSALFLATAISVMAAVASFRFVEEPLRSLPTLTRPRTVALIGATICVPVMVAGVVGVIARDFWTPRLERGAVEANRMHAGYVLGCHFGQQDGAVDPEPCRWNVDAAGAPVYLVGDSNAAHFVEGLVEAAERSGRPLVVTTSSGCPLVELVIEGPTAPGYGEVCRARSERVVDWLGSQPRGTVFLSNSDEYWLSSEYRIVGDDAESAATTAKVGQMRSALVETAEDLRSAGHEVVLIQSIPHFTGELAWDSAECTLAASIRGCPKVMPLSDPLELSAPVRRALDEVGQVTGARVVDLANSICPEGVCRSTGDQMPIYRDAEHISVAMSRALAPEFLEIVRGGPAPAAP